MVRKISAYRKRTSENTSNSLISVEITSNLSVVRVWIWSKLTYLENVIWNNFCQTWIRISDVRQIFWIRLPEFWTESVFDNYLAIARWIDSIFANQWPTSKTDFGLFELCTFVLSILHPICWNKNKHVTKKHDKLNDLRQDCVLQLTFRVLLPLHSEEFSFWYRQFLFWMTSPPPQVTLHWASLFHSVQKALKRISILSK